jgi:hypothetical protein
MELPKVFQDSDACYFKLPRHVGGRDRLGKRLVVMGDAGEDPSLLARQLVRGLDRNRRHQPSSMAATAAFTPRLKQAPQ